MMTHLAINGRATIAKPAKRVNTGLFVTEKFYVVKSFEAELTGWVVDIGLFVTEKSYESLSVDFARVARLFIAGRVSG